MTEIICPFCFVYQNRTLCSLGSQCARKVPYPKLNCQTVFIKKNITAEEIEKLKQEAIHHIHNQTVPLSTYLLPSELDNSPSSLKSIEEKKTEFQNKIKGLVFKD